MKRRWAEVDRYIADLLAPSDPALDNALQASKAAGLPRRNVPPTRGKLLMLLARAINAKAILEIGTLGGYSSIWLARGLLPAGRLITLELEPSHAEVARASLAQAGFANIAEVRIGPALESLPLLLGERPFDLIFIDADSTNLPEYIRWALRLSRRGSLIFVDNVVRAGSIMDAETPKSTIQALRRFYDFVAAETKISMTVIQTVGAGGHDGFAIGLVTADP